MTTTADAAADVEMIALEAIRTDRNVRQELDAAEVDALAQSMRLLQPHLARAGGTSAHLDICPIDSSRPVCDLSPKGPICGGGSYP
jgi:hypothetical protein